MTPNNIERYSRQIRFQGVGEAGQARLLRSSAAIVGCGALGTLQAGVLARAGLRKLILIDRDFVEWSNLQRQWLFEERDAREALPKAIAAANRLRAINSDLVIDSHIADLTPENIEELLSDAHVVLDGTDNFETRYLLNDYAVSRGIPWIYGGAVGSYGITMPIVPATTACFTCVYPDPPSGAQPTCETAGILGPATAIVAALQCADAIKLLTGNTVSPRITMFDVWQGITRQTGAPARDPLCRTCALREFPHLNGHRRAPISLCGRNAVQIHERRRPIDLPSLQAELSPLGEVRANEFALRFIMQPYEMTIFPDGRAIIKGTADVGVARSLYARYIGN